MPPSLRLFAAGSNAQGQLGNDSNEDSHTFQACRLPPDFASCHSIVDLATGANHTIALTEDQLGKRTLWGCGDGRAGQLGPDIIRLGAIASFQRLTLGEQFEGYEICRVAASWQTTYVVLSSVGVGDIVVSMGSNDYGDLGSKHIGAVHNSPNVVDFDLILGERPFSVQNISTGQHHVILSLLFGEDTLVVGWGASRHGQLGADPSILLPNGKLPLYIDHPIIIPLETNDSVVDVALGSRHSLLLHTSGMITGLGTNRKGQLDDGLKALEGVKSIACTWNGSYAVIEGNSVVAYGANARGQLGHSTMASADARVQLPFHATSEDHVKIACGSEHALLLYRDVVWGWGWNEHGNLGVGSTEDVTFPVEIWPSPKDGSETNVVGIWAGLGTSWIALNSG